MRTNGPSLDESRNEDVRVSARVLAGMANARAQDIEYWRRKGYLNQNGDGGTEEEEGDAESQAYKLSQLPKARLMALFVKRLGMKASKASQLADQFLEVYGDRPEAFSATIGVVELLETRLTALVDLILELDLVPRIAKLVKEQT